MTAPNTTPGPTGASPAPVTPVAPASPDYSGLDPMERTIAETLNQSRDVVGDGLAEQPRDATGRFVPRSTAVPQAADAAAAAPGTQPPGEPAPVAVPEGHVIPKALAPEKVQGFRVLDAEGEIVPPDLTFEVLFRGPNGENSRPRTLDLLQLVNYARQGAYNHERERTQVEVSQQNQTLQARIAEYDTAVRQMQDERALLLSDADYLLKALNQHEQEQTPEAQTARAREQLELQRAAMVYEQAGAENERYMEQRLEPALSTLAEAYPLVALEDLANQLVQLSAPYTVQTPFGPIVHPQAHANIAHLVVHQLAPWAEQLHLEREERYRSLGSGNGQRTPAFVGNTAPAPAPAPAVNAELQARAQRARRLATAAIQPPGGNGALPAPSATAAAPAGNSRDMQDFVVGRSLQQTRGA